jgi:hypothetical protein
MYNKLENKVYYVNNLGIYGENMQGLKSATYNIDRQAHYARERERERERERDARSI